MPMREHPSGETGWGPRDTALSTDAARKEVNEAASIGALLDEVPGQIADVPVSLLVIDDCSADGTSEVARRHGALVCLRRPTARMIVTPSRADARITHA